jgi:hypothetical protein
VKIRRNQISDREIQVRAGERLLRVRAVYEKEGRWFASCHERLLRTGDGGAREYVWFPVELSASGAELAGCLETACRQLIAELQAG